MYNTYTPPTPAPMIFIQRPSKEPTGHAKLPLALVSSRGSDVAPPHDEFPSNGQSQFVSLPGHILRSKVNDRKAMLFESVVLYNGALP